MALIIVMGVPGSGKSTFCRRIEAANPEKVRIYSFDEFRTNRTPDSDRSGRQERVDFQNFVRQQHLADVTLVEDTFHLKSMRRRFYRLAADLQLAYAVVHPKTSLDVAIQWDKKRSEVTGSQVIKKIHETMELEVKAMSEDIDLEELLRCAIVPPLGKNVTAEKVTSQPSELTVLDEKLRKTVSQLMSIDRFDGKKMSLARLRLFKLIKHGMEEPRDVQKWIIEEHQRNCHRTRYKRWEQQTVTWSFEDPYRMLTTKQYETIRSLVRVAFQKWQNTITGVVDLTEVGLNDEPDIRIFFAKKNHSCSENFDGRGGIVAHSSYPSAGLLHLDADEKWHTGDSRKGDVDLRYVLLHEIGHVLGLRHSRKPGSVMNKDYVNSDVLPFKLSPYDEISIRKLYT